MFVDHLLITKKEYKNVEKHEIQDITIKQNQINPAFSMTCLREILKIYLEEQLSKLLPEKSFNNTKNPNI